MEKAFSSWESARRVFFWREKKRGVLVGPERKVIWVRKRFN